MNDIARRLRAQKAYSTDPAYLERMAREEETRGVDAPRRERLQDKHEDKAPGVRDYDRRFAAGNEATP